MVNWPLYHLCHCCSPNHSTNRFVCMDLAFGTILCTFSSRWRVASCSFWPLWQVSASALWSPRLFRSFCAPATPIWWLRFLVLPNSCWIFDLFSVKQLTSKQRTHGAPKWHQIKWFFLLFSSQAFQILQLVVHFVQQLVLLLYFHIEFTILKQRCTTFGLPNSNLFRVRIDELWQFAGWTFIFRERIVLTLVQRFQQPIFIGQFL